MSSGHTVVSSFTDRAVLRFADGSERTYLQSDECDHIALLDFLGGGHPDQLVDDLVACNGSDTNRCPVCWEDVDLHLVSRSGVLALGDHWQGTDDIFYTCLPDGLTWVVDPRAVS
jgi:alkylhydroperoxidase family enzyme